MIEETIKKVKLIQEKIKAAQDRQKSYADEKRRDVEFQIGEKKVGKVADVSDLPNELERVHNVFHVSQIRKYVPNVAHVLEPEIIELDESLTYEEKPVRILDSKIKSTRNKDVKIVKVLWSNHKVEEATWEAEAEMRKEYPNLFMVSG
ncbi:uncharacterized protein LOC110724064 [Chenopodium quinoa]|uniref:uncharacterized protein LOC110724064 n=1 Tax=Chenopodium quinoa TaxID=63459 RepID=UPI000B78625A|nr:uncharacterized protein LOC110724064 [Chenopodium quinoa]